jgi:hypothetical protein
MRVEQGAFRSKEDCNGSRYYLHRLTDNPRPDATSPVRAGVIPNRADTDTLHEVYSALLARLALSKEHRDALRRRGLSDAAIDGGSYRSLPIQGRARIVRDLRESFEDVLLRVPGFVVKEGEHGPYPTLRGPAGLLVPCRNREGSIVALKVRREDAPGGKRRYVYVSSTGHGGPGPGSPVHVPLGCPEMTDLVRVTEGELKADIIQALTGTPTFSVPGATNWLPILDVLKAASCKMVRLAFDADAWDKPTVAKALAAFAEALLEAGFAVELERWDATDGKGLDDLLAVGKTPAVLQGEEALRTVQDIVASAFGDEEPAPPDELARLHEVLNAGGAEALFLDWSLLQALADLAVSDPAAFASIRASIGKRVSLRDLDKTIRSIHRDNPQGAVDAPAPYFVEGGCIHRNVPTKDGPPISVPLCNFDARLVEEVVRDDGAEQTRVLCVEGTMCDGSPLPRVEVPSASFEGMGWPLAQWGPHAVVHAGMGTRDHLRVGLQLLSGKVPRRTVFQHTGWRKIGEEWFYLHAGGAIGANGVDSEVLVSLPESLGGFLLPAPPALLGTNFPGPLGDAARREYAELQEAVRASLGFLRVGPDRLTFPILAAVYRAVLGETDFGLHLSGATGSFKTEVAALAQQHYGAGMDARHLPAGWSSTGNSLEGLAFTAKDALLVVDDFCPVGSTHDVQRYHKEADRLFRGQGNRSGRQRMRPDGTQRPPKPPRGLVCSTGEDTPRGQSLRARLFDLHVSPGDFGPQSPDPNPELTACQRDAAAGKYALAMAGYLRWLAPQYEEIRARLREQATELREEARAAGQHARTPGIAADLALGLRYFLDFARSIDAITPTEWKELWERGWNAIREAAGAQASQILDSEPAALFMRLLAAAVAGGYAHLADDEGDPPPEPQCWGWRAEEYSTGDGVAIRHRQQGTCVGWLVEGEVYLEPDASYAAAQEIARDQGDGFPITANTLRRRLNEKGLLASIDAKRKKLTVRKTLQGHRREVLHVVWDSTPTPADAVEDAADAGGGPKLRAGSCAENDEVTGEPAHETLDFPREKGSVGRKGRSDEEGEPAAASCNGQRAEEWGGLAMTSTEALLADLRSRGIELKTDGSRLRWRPAFLVSEPQAAEILSHRALLIDLLTNPAASDGPRCKDCGWPLDSARRCPKCFDRLCEVCGKLTGSYIIMRCVACGQADESTAREAAAESVNPQMISKRGSEPPASTRAENDR